VILAAACSAASSGSPAPSARGHAVDLVARAPPGPGDWPVPEGVRLVVLPRLPKLLAKLLPLLADPAALHLLAPGMLTKARPSPTIANLPGLVRYLRRERPLGIVAAPTDLNLEAVWARRLAGVPTRIVVSEHVHLSTALEDSSPWRQRHFPILVRRCYSMADVIVAVSAGVADDLARSAGLPRGDPGGLQPRRRPGPRRVRQGAGRSSLVPPRGTAGRPRRRPAHRAEGLSYRIRMISSR
jgi:hypothetical protein